MEEIQANVGLREQQLSKLRSNRRQCAKHRSLTRCAGKQAARPGEPILVRAKWECVCTSVRAARRLAEKGVCLK